MKRILKLNNENIKILKYNNSVLTKEININELFIDKTVLLLYPYPSKGRLNSELSDSILNMSKLTNLPDEAMENKFAADEISKIKYIKNLDYIIGLSDMDYINTVEALRNIKIRDVTFLPECNLFKNNKLSRRFEIIVKNGEIIEYRKDPSYFRLLIYFITLSSILTFIGYTSQNVYMFLFKKYF